MVTISRVGFERKLGAMASVLSSTSRRYPLLGLVQDGHIRLWQDGDMPVWKTEEIDSDENFFFSVPTNTLKDIVGGFKSASVDLLSDGRGSLTVKSGRSQVSVPYMEGVYDEIPDPPSLGVSCTTSPQFLDFLSKSKDFVAKTFDQEGLIYTYIGSLDKQFLISGTNGFAAFTALVPYDGDDIPSVVVPSEFAVAAAKLLSSTSDVCMGISENLGHVVLSNEDTTMYTPRVQKNYPDAIIKLAINEGIGIFNMNRQDAVTQLKLALQTTNQDLVGLAPDTEGGGVRVSVPRATIEADLIIEDAEIIEEFDTTYFQLPFLIQGLSTLSSERVNVEILPDFKGSFRISSDDNTATTTVLPYLLTDA